MDVEYESLENEKVDGISGISPATGMNREQELVEFR
jgi:hypothetical protein